MQKSHSTVYICIFIAVAGFLVYAGLSIWISMADPAARAKVQINTEANQLNALVAGKPLATPLKSPQLVNSFGFNSTNSTNWTTLCLNTTPTKYSIVFGGPDATELMRLTYEHEIIIPYGKGTITIDEKTGHVRWKGTVPDAQARQFWDAIVIAHKSFPR